MPRTDSFAYTWWARVVEVLKVEADVLLERWQPVTDGRLRLRWEPASSPTEALRFSSEASLQSPAGGAGTVSGSSPALARAPVQDIMGSVELHDGVSSHAAARAQAKTGWVLCVRRAKQMTIGKQEARRLGLAA